MNPLLGRSFVLKGGLLFDGGGGPPFVGDVRVEDGLIVEIGRHIHGGAKLIVSVDGLAVAPGFIDFHSHADFTLPDFPTAINSLTQGVTTEVLGNCGWSPAPVAPAGNRRDEWIAISSALGPALNWEWSTLSEYHSHLERAMPSVNCILLVGHGALRTKAMGLEARPASAPELDAMRDELVAALAAGAWGMSTGLVYTPGSYAQTDELVELAKVLAVHGGLYASHIRGEGSTLQDAVQEAITIARTTGVQVHISHLKSIGVANRGQLTLAIRQIEAAVSEGLPISADVYPYAAGSTLMLRILPEWSYEGGIDKLLQRIRIGTVRERIEHEINSDPNSRLNESGGWDGVLIGSIASPALRSIQGRKVSDIAQDWGKTPEDVIFEVIAADQGRSTMVNTIMDPKDWHLALEFERTVIGSDQLGVTGPYAHVHPRAYGTFAKVLREASAHGHKALSRAIHKMSFRPASLLGLDDRGIISEGKVADVVVFDPITISDSATYSQPYLIASGIEFVFVGGVPSIVAGKPCELQRGRVLNRISR